MNCKRNLLKQRTLRIFIIAIFFGLLVQTTANANRLENETTDGETTASTLSFEYIGYEESEEYPYKGVFNPVVYTTYKEEKQNNNDDNIVIIDTAKETDNDTAPVYYYVDDNGFKSYLDKDLQDHLWGELVAVGQEEHYKMFIAQMYHESGFNEDLVSSSGDYGISQINSCNFPYLRDTLGVTDFLDPYESIRCEVHFMSRNLEKYQNEAKALTVYNRGHLVNNGITDYSNGVLEDKQKLVVQQGE